MTTLTETTIVYRPRPSRKPAFDALALRHASIEVRHAPTTLVPERFEVRCLDDEDQVVAIRRLDGGGRNV